MSNVLVAAPQDTEVYSTEVVAMEEGFGTSAQLAQLASALALAQANFTSVSKNAVNPHFRSRYADLASLIEATREALGKQGLTVIQSTRYVGGRLEVVSRLLHKSGEWVESSISLRPEKDTPQAVGSTITYGRRYGLSALLNICADEDDDGNSASGVKK